MSTGASSSAALPIAHVVLRILFAEGTVMRDDLEGTV
jgi:hypothetical protein